MILCLIQYASNDWIEVDNPDVKDFGFENYVQVLGGTVLLTRSNPGRVGGGGGENFRTCPFFVYKLAEGLTPYIVSSHRFRSLRFYVDGRKRFRNATFESQVCWKQS